MGDLMGFKLMTHWLRDRRSTLSARKPHEGGYLLNNDITHRYSTLVPGQPPADLISSYWHTNNEIIIRDVAILMHYDNTKHYIQVYWGTADSYWVQI